jgi:hypothetical protein
LPGDGGLRIFALSITGGDVMSTANFQFASARFTMASQRCARQCLALKRDTDQEVLLDGVGGIALGLELLCTELEAIGRQLDDIQTALRRVAPARRP